MPASDSQCLPLTLNNVGQALLSLTAAYITFAKAVTLRKFRSSNLFNKRFRDTVADFAPTIGTAPTYAHLREVSFSSERERCARMSWRRTELSAGSW